jgi:hypothetical protein
VADDEGEELSLSEVLQLAGHPLASRQFLRASALEEGERPLRFYPNPDDALDELGLWVEVDGGDLIEPVRMRINRGADGRFAVTGLVLGPSARQEITSDTLRRLRLAEIIRTFVDGWNPNQAPDPDGDQDEFLSYWLFKEHVVDVVQLAGTVDTPSRGPRDDEYRRFAATYLRERARNPQRAMTAAAAAHSISRTTANRWAKACRERGYLPPREQPS